MPRLLASFQAAECEISSDFKWLLLVLDDIGCEELATETVGFDLLHLCFGWGAIIEEVEDDEAVGDVDETIGGQEVAVDEAVKTVDRVEEEVEDDEAVGEVDEGSEVAVDEAVKTVDGVEEEVKDDEAVGEVDERTEALDDEVEDALKLWKWRFWTYPIVKEG